MFIELLHSLHLGFPFLDFWCAACFAFGPITAVHGSVSALACSLSAGLSHRMMIRVAGSDDLMKLPNKDPYERRDRANIDGFR
jgi:hypothetical protein